MEDSVNTDICRVCRCEGTADRPLFHPCICTGSIKFIHQECLLQWLRYSKKEFCELCNYRFSFTPIYSPDMPKRLPLRLVMSGLAGTVGRAVKFWLHYTLVAVAWLGVVPLTACRIYRTLFTGSVSTILSLPVNVFSTEHIGADIMQGGAVVSLTLLAFIGLVWLREQILHGGGPAWLEPEEAVQVAAAVAAVAPHLEPAPQQPAPPQPAPQPEQQPPIPLPAAQENVDVDEGEVDPMRNVPEEPAAPEIVDPAAEVPGEGMGDDQQWNPMEWDRAAEELTWERLLGLDGSLVFLEHVFWVVSLNTLFILVFAFCPYHIGHFTIAGLKLKSFVEGIHFEGLMITTLGYCMVGLSLVLLHAVTSFLKFKKSSRILGLCYVVVKVALLLVAEIVAFPVICGWWLDICSLSLFDATLKDRFQSFNNGPCASVFIHWLVGMVYVFYFASFVILLREVLRPGVLWFLRNLNDPDFNPIQEMIHLSLARHVRRFCASLVMFGSSILVMLYCPSRIIRSALPSFLPYTTQTTESNVDELAMELLLLLVILPAVQDQNHSREWLKCLVKYWCAVVSWTLDLRSYLFGDVPMEGDDETAGQQDNGAEDLLEEEEADDEEEDDDDDEEVDDEDEEGEDDEDDNPADHFMQLIDHFHGEEGGLGAAHQALLQREGPVGFQPYKKPKYFVARICCLLLLMVMTWLSISLLMMVIPVWFGRQIFSLWTVEGHRVYELYTSATGLYLCLLAARAIVMFATWLKQGWSAFGKKLREWGLLAARTLVAFVLLAGLIPFMFGILLELVVLTPVRVPLHQSPIYFLWQDWALGAMYTKITVAITFMGPDWWLKLAIEEVYQGGIRNINLRQMIMNLVLPVANSLGVCLCVPYVVSHGLAPLVIADFQLLTLIQRRIYPFMLLTLLLTFLMIVQFKQFKKLVEHIKNDRYLVGRRLVNYNHDSRDQEVST